VFIVRLPFLARRREKKQNNGAVKINNSQSKASSAVTK
jgi:hypothetical protein